MQRVLLVFCIACLATVTEQVMSLKNAVVTGANKGLGLEMCRQLCSDDRFQAVYALCRQRSGELQSLVSSSKQKVKVVEGVDVTRHEETLRILRDTFKSDGESPIPIHLLIHNAGGYGPPEKLANPDDMYATQSLENITLARMRYALELNTLAPLAISQALLPNLRAEAAEDDPSKLIIISSAMGSLDDNTSGGHYGYRTAKAAVNMVGRSMSVDLKADHVAVSMVHPGFVFTNFDGRKSQGLERRPGQRDIGESVRGVLQAVEQTTLSNTGSFWHGGYGEGTRSLAW